MIFINTLLLSELADGRATAYKTRLLSRWTPTHSGLRYLLYRLHGGDSARTPLLLILTHWVSSFSQPSFFSFSSFHFHIKQRPDGGRGRGASINAASRVWKKISPPSFINLQDIKAEQPRGGGDGGGGGGGTHAHRHRVHAKTKHAFITKKPSKYLDG